MTYHSLGTRHVTDLLHHGCQWIASKRVGQSGDPQKEAKEASLLTWLARQGTEGDTGCYHGVDLMTGEQWRGAAESTQRRKRAHQLNVHIEPAAARTERQVAARHGAVLVALAYAAGGRRDRRRVGRQVGCRCGRGCAGGQSAGGKVGSEVSRARKRTATTEWYELLSSRESAGRTDGRGIMESREQERAKAAQRGRRVPQQRTRSQQEASSGEQN